MESLFPRVRKSLSHLVLPTRTKQYIQNPRKLMAPALHRSESVMELGTKRCLLRQNISLLDMGDTLGVCFVLVFVWNCYRSHSYSSISPGRFFVANEVKTLLGHILVTYDIKFEARERPQYYR